MRGRVTILAGVAMLLLAPTLWVGVPTAAAITGSFTLTIDCAGNPETTAITNNTDRTLDLARFTLTSFSRARTQEPFRLTGTLVPGATRTFLSGEKAPATDRLTAQFIYENRYEDYDGALISSSSYGQFSVLCSDRTGTRRMAEPMPVPVPGSTPEPDQRCFPETGFCIAGRFLAHWRSNFGLALKGFPITPERRERLEDGNEYTVQYFERVRLERHPDNEFPHDVVLGQFGRRILENLIRSDLARYQRYIVAVEATPGATYFPETGHNLAGGFLAYWGANGGLPQFGFPLTEEFIETLEDGRDYRVQYFERARFEYHPENAPPFDVLLGQFGRRILAEVDGGR